MPIDFSLSRKPESVLPITLEDDAGTAYRIDPCYRTVLACLRVINDPDTTTAEKYLYLASRFFLGNPPPNMSEMFGGFVSGNADGGQTDAPAMDFEVDAAAIYASFRQQYGIDLFAEDLHWVIFRALLAGLGESTPFGQRVKVRTMDDSDLTPKGRAQLRRLKDMWSIAPRESQAERDMQAEIAVALERGEDPQPIIARYQKGV